MEIPGYLHCPLNCDRRGQQRICAAHPRGIGTRCRGIEVRHLGARVHAGIGAAGAGHADRLAGDFRERALEMILHGVA